MGTRTDDEYLSELQRLADEHGEPVTREDIKEHGQYSPTPYHREFDSLFEARKEAGLERGLDRHEARIETDTKHGSRPRHCWPIFAM
ncbi:hypothetical protein CP556_21510 [Natrinema sp. CBA1119]|uniref:homing endonuclease associated repeat-containing protein n=1 Tax=Natrinema sp. CBA1119 TaxID=1608465 RepID=UPI000BF37C1D|nr:hypothetical protein [Natrinema sp. CBA1119]PGF14338.1 hypothetical protein CP556_21765 [Natrinema sp. CBA1119]PGF14438.1 hypothetical protein CP556_21510 [Natrinema sp. CBA1119]